MKEMLYEVRYLKSSEEIQVTQRDSNNCLNCPASARIISSLDFEYRTSYNTSFILHSCVTS